MDVRNYVIVGKINCVIVVFFPSIVFIFCFAEEECYHCLASLVAAKEKVFITQTKLLYEVTWKTVMQIAKKHAVSFIFSSPSVSSFFFKFFILVYNLKWNKFYVLPINKIRTCDLNRMIEIVFVEISCSPFATNLSGSKIGTNFYGLELVDLGRITISSSC